MSQIILHSSINQHKKFTISKYQNTTLINNKMPHQTFSLTGLGPLMMPPGAPNKVSMLYLMHVNDNI